MPRTIRFHLDEQVPHAIAHALRAHGINVTTTTEAGLIGVSDDEQVAYALSENRVIFTQDRDFLRFHAAEGNHAGIAYCAQGTRSIGDVVRGLWLIWEVLDPEDMQNTVEFL